MKEYIKMQNVNYEIKGREILKNINLSLNGKKVTSLIGPNGSGKTTLGKLATGIYKCSSGKIKLDNQYISKLELSEIGEKIGYLFQNPDKQIFTPTVYEELAFSLKYKGIEKKEIDRRIDYILEVFNMEHMKKATTFFLSRGEKQRLALAAVVINNPEYLVLDEPTTGLDTHRKEKLSILIESLRGKIGVLLISHDIKFIEKHSDRILEMKEGRLKND